MIGLTSLDVSNSIFEKTSETLEFDLSQAIEKRRKRYSLVDWKFIHDIFRPKGLKGEILGPAFFDKLKEFDFGDISQGLSIC